MDNLDVLFDKVAKDIVDFARTYGDGFHCALLDVLANNANNSCVVGKQTTAIKFEAFCLVEGKLHHVLGADTLGNFLRDGLATVVQRATGHDGVCHNNGNIHAVATHIHNYALTTSKLAKQLDGIGNGSFHKGNLFCAQFQKQTFDVLFVRTDHSAGYCAQNGIIVQVCHARVNNV